MANKEHLELLRQGVKTWNNWRRKMWYTLYNDAQNKTSNTKENHYSLNIDEFVKDFADQFAKSLEVSQRVTELCTADLSGADLKGANLNGADFSTVNLSMVDLSKADLCGADFTDADLSKAQLVEANIASAKLFRTDLGEANLSGANLIETIFKEANLSKANFSKSILTETFLLDVDLSKCVGLDSCIHYGPSYIEYRTLQNSGSLPENFLRGTGLPDSLISYLASPLNQPTQFCTCFISYSSKDEAFAERLHSDLQDKGVRCWFAPHDMPSGAKIIEAIDEAIRLRDKVLLVLSEGAIASDWVEREVTRSLDEEQERKRLLLVPIRIDDAVLNTKQAWARQLRVQRHIGNFTSWEEKATYNKSLHRLLRDLKKTDNH